MSLLFLGCGQVNSDTFRWVGAQHPRRFAAGSAISVWWSKRLTKERTGPYQPVETSRAALDPRRNRLYVGTSDGTLHALGPDGEMIYRYDAEGSIESQPALDHRSGQLIVGTEQGTVHAIHSLTGERQWAASVGGAVRTPPVFSSDAVHFSTGSDEIVALDREKGTQLWTYGREASEGFALTRHAGMLLEDQTLFCAFTDGAVVALDATDGSIRWERDTSVDVEPEAQMIRGFVDVDTTPVRHGSAIYVASFSGGLYALDPHSGTVGWHRSDLTGVTALAKKQNLMVLSSADQGVVVLDLDSREVRWKRTTMRGHPSEPVIAGRAVFVGESRGSLLALDLDRGSELFRLESGYGFSASPSISGAFGFVLSNGGRLTAFRLKESS